MDTTANEASLSPLSSSSIECFEADNECFEADNGSKHTLIFLPVNQGNKQQKFK
jgi:hypothetical protein